MTQNEDLEDDVLPVSPPSLPPPLLRKRKVHEQNKGSRKRVKKEMKLTLSPIEVARLENGEMLNDTHIDIAN